MGKVTTSRELQKSASCAHLLYFHILLSNSYFHFCISLLSFLMPNTFSRTASYTAASDQSQTPSIYCSNHFCVKTYPPCYLFQISWTPSPSLKATRFLGTAFEEEAIKPLSLHTFSPSTVFSHYCSLNSLDASRSNFSCPVTRPANFPEGKGGKRKIKMFL